MKTIELKCGGKIYAVNDKGEVAELNRFEEFPIWSRTLTFEGVDKPVFGDLQNLSNHRKEYGYFDIEECFENPNNIMGAYPQIFRTIDGESETIAIEAIKEIHVPYYSDPVTFMSPEDEAEQRERQQAKKWVDDSNIRKISDGVAWLSNQSDIAQGILNGCRGDFEKVDGIIVELALKAVDKFRASNTQIEHQNKGEKDETK